MAMFLIYALLIALILPLGSLLATVEDSAPGSDYRGAAAVALALGGVFLGLALAHPAEAPDAWAFRGFHGVLCALSVAAANLFVCLEHARA